METTVEVTLMEIFNILYLDTNEEGNFYNIDKEWDADTLDSIGKIVNRWANTLPDETRRRLKTF